METAQPANHCTNSHDRHTPPQSPLLRVRGTPLFFGSKLNASTLNPQLPCRLNYSIAAKTKGIEYRAQTPYWKRRLEGRRYDAIQFRNGYATKAPEMLVEFRGLRRYSTGRNACYAIRLGRILSIKRWKA